MASTTTKEVIETRDIYVGSPKATITLICYMDYESTECARLNSVLNELLVTYEGKIRVNIRHFPLANKHQRAMKAAEAVVAAAQESLFWPMHNLVFENQKNLGTTTLKQYARTVGCTDKRYLDNVINGIFAWQVREDLLEALDAGVRSVPTVSVNGITVDEDLNIDTLTLLIENQLNNPEF